VGYILGVRELETKKIIGLKSGGEARGDMGDIHRKQGQMENSNRGLQDIEHYKTSLNG